MLIRLIVTCVNLVTSPTMKELVNNVLQANIQLTPVQPLVYLVLVVNKPTSTPLAVYSVMQVNFQEKEVNVNHVPSTNTLPLLALALALLVVQDQKLH